MDVGFETRLHTNLFKSQNTEVKYTYIEQIQQFSGFIESKLLKVIHGQATIVFRSEPSECDLLNKIST